MAEGKVHDSFHCCFKIAIPALAYLSQTHEESPDQRELKVFRSDTDQENNKIEELLGENAALTLENERLREVIAQLNEELTTQKAECAAHIKLLSEEKMKLADQTKTDSGKATAARTEDQQRDTDISALAAQVTQLSQVNEQLRKENEAEIKRTSGELIVMKSALKATGCDGIPPQIFCTSLKRYVKGNRSYTFSNGTVYCLLDVQTIICVGGSDPSKDAWLLNAAYNRVTSLQSMPSGHNNPGIIKHSSAVYVFGNFQPYSTASDKYSLSTCSWSRLSDMGKPRGGFSPCLFREKILLPCVSAGHKVMEAFVVATEQFELMSVMLPAQLSGWTVSFIVDGELTMIAWNQQIAKIKCGDETNFRVFL